MNNNPNLGINPQVFSNVLGAKYLSKIAGASACRIVKHIGHSELKKKQGKRNPRVS